jgi:hypothetical protein
VPVSDKLTPVIDAWEQTTGSTSELCATLADTDWDRMTECPA